MVQSRSLRVYDDARLVADIMHKMCDQCRDVAIGHVSRCNVLHSLELLDSDDRVAMSSHACGDDRKDIPFMSSPPHLKATTVMTSIGWGQ